MMYIIYNNLYYIVYYISVILTCVLYINCSLKLYCILYINIFDLCYIELYKA